MKIGRPSKYSPQLVGRIFELVSRGLNYNQVADAVGICRDTLSEWQREFPDFSDTLKRAKVLGIARRLARIERAAQQGHWQADAWWLERVCREQFARHSVVKAEMAEQSAQQKPTFNFAEYARICEEVLGSRH